MAAARLFIGLLLLNLWLRFGVWAILTVATEVVVHVGPIACLASLVLFLITWSVGPLVIGLAWEEWSAARRLGLRPCSGDSGCWCFGRSSTVVACRVPCLLPCPMSAMT
jgi:hypothetical protein